ncbi:hypothetical protein FHS07_001095 [Microbacterium proteolyticum]|uniref:Uncharacterized protein n=1 Tax=Microbacterium proteolyticum TaxID=1572644 RepID=A0A7W5CGT2_9MICO|nr:hypothetical protein [Microbacterium proteolyticum]MBB3157411.1 hypothetical protein [Microbacterium proteolyticum]
MLPLTSGTGKTGDSDTGDPSRDRRHQTGLPVVASRGSPTIPEEATLATSMTAAHGVRRTSGPTGA